MINIHHVRFSALTTILVLSMVVLTTIDGSHNSALAQNITSTLLPSQLPAQDSTSTPTTPAIEPSGNDDESSSSDDSDNTNGNGDDDSGDDSDSQQDTSSSDDDDSGDDSGDGSDSPQDTSSSDEEEAETEDNSEQTNPLLEQIRNTVNGTLFASGIVVP